MTWLKRILIGLAIVVGLVIVIVLAISHWSPAGRSTETMSMTVGNRTITVSGHYKTMSQETMADGMKVIIDGHVIAATPGELAIDGAVQSFEPSQDVEIWIDEKGGVQAKAASSDGAGPEQAPIN